jgi:NAD(P)H-nitrite reductase large subunit
MKLSNETTTISMQFHHGKIDEDVLLNLASVMKKYQIPGVKISGAKGFVLAGVNVADVEAVCSELNLLKPAVTKRKVIIQACSGNRSCVKGLQDAEKLADQIEQIIIEIPLPGKLKVAVSGCANCCAKSMVRDLGFIAQPEGWTLTVGGMTGGAKPRVADIIATGLDENEILELAKKVLENYIQQAKDGERIAQTIDRIGINSFKGCD